MNFQMVYGMCLPEDDTHFAEQIRNNPTIDGKGTYQYKKLCAAIMECKERKVAIDVGAHVGLWTRILAREFQHVKAFEPIEEHFECLVKNVPDSHVIPYKFALGNAVGHLPMKKTVDIATARISRFNEDRDCDVAIKTLDSFAFTDVDFIKIDTEGYERHVVVGAEQTIRTCKPTIVVEQKRRTRLYDDEEFGAVRLLESWGASLLWGMSGDYCLGWR